MMMLLMFGSMYGNKPTPMFGGYGTVDVSVPSYTVMIIGTAGLMSLVPIIASYRERGILRRFSTTPLKPLTFLCAEVSVLFVMTVAGMLLLVATAKVVYGLRFVGNVASVAAAFVLACLSFYSLGFLLAGVLPTYRTASTVTMVVFYPMLFMSGAGMPRELLPAWMRKVAEVFPMTHAVTLLKGVWFGEPWSEFRREVAILAAILVAGMVLSSRLFRWD
jgi:ABC-2 type transport system permease protein